MNQPPSRPPEPPPAYAPTAPSAAPFEAGASPFAAAPLYLPAGPPGTAFDGGDQAPPVLPWFRLYMGLIIAQYAAFALFGAAGLVTAGFKGGSPSTEDMVVGVVCMAIGGLFAAPHLVVLFGGRSPWVHTMGTVLLALSMIGGGGCCVIPGIAILVQWTHADTKRWFERGSFPHEHRS